MNKYLKHSSDLVIDTRVQTSLCIAEPRNQVAGRRSQVAGRRSQLRSQRSFEGSRARVVRCRELQIAAAQKFRTVTESSALPFTKG